LVSERDLNPSVDGQFVLKVSNPAERSDLIDMETKALAHARAVAPDLPLPETVSTVTGTGSASVRDESGRACLARLITVVPGAPAEGQPVASDLAEEIGALCARTSLALQGMFHPAASQVHRLGRTARGRCSRRGSSSAGRHGDRSGRTPEPVPGRSPVLLVCPVASTTQT
jgi:Ser/Thr protein kinase RdoA (MazF antagonist)